jgi:hypothetical protein
MGKKAIKLMLAGTPEKMGYKSVGGQKVEIVNDDSED